MSVVNDTAVQTAKIAMTVHQADGRPVLHLRLDRGLLERLAGRERVTVPGSDLRIDWSALSGTGDTDFRYVTLTVDGRG